MHEDGNISVYNVKNKMLVGYLNENSKKVNSIKWFSSKLANSFLTCGESLLMYSSSADSWSSISLLKMKSLEKVELTAIGMHPSQPYVLCGTNQGSLWYINAAKRSIISSHNISALKVVGISFDSTGNYIAIAYSNGLVNLYNSQLDFLLQLEQPFGVSLSEDEVICANVILFDLIPIANKDQFNSISLHSNTTIRIHRILINRSQLTKEVVTDILISEGNITSFALHPSKEYIILTNNKELLYIYHVPSSQLKKQIKIPFISKECKLDPSGIYAAIANNDIEKLNDLAIIKKIRVIDIETGSAIAEISDIGDIISFEFSSDGKYFTVVTAGGAIMIYEVFGIMRKRIVRVLDTNYWHNKPLQQNNIKPIETARSQVFTKASLSKELLNIGSPKRHFLPPLTLSKPYSPVSQSSLRELTKSATTKEKVFTIRKINKHSPTKFQRESTFYGITRSLYKGRYDNTLKQEELPKALSIDVYSSKKDWRQVGTRWIQPDPEDIDISEDLKEESAITKGIEESMCDSVDRMYEEIQAFTTTVTKANPINI